MRLKDRIEGDLHIPTRIRLGSPGSLDVLAGGQLIFSKKQAGHMPSPDEIVGLLRNRHSA